MAWISFANRPSDLRASIESKCIREGFSGAAEDFYNDHEYGLLSDSELREELVSPRTQTSLEEGRAFEVKTLRYLRNNADQAEDRQWAEIVHNSLLLDLWLQHVAETGDTYYPPLAEDLFQSYQLQEEGNHN